MTPYSFDVWHSGFVERVPNQRGAHQRKMNIVAGRRFEQRKAAQNRIVAKVERFDLNHRHGRLITRVVARPLSKRAFGQEIVRRHFPFDGDLRIRRNGQTGKRPFHHFQRPAEHSAGIIIFVNAIRHIGGCKHEVDGMVTERNRNRQRFSPRVIFVSVHPAVFPRRHV